MSEHTLNSKHLKMDVTSSMITAIILLAKGRAFDKILGHESGADDYGTKPCSPKELVAWKKDVLRRNQSRPIESWRRDRVGCHHIQGGIVRIP